MRINHNIQALNAYSKLSKNQFTTGKALEKLSSGLRINRAADDAAGLAISEKMRGQIRGLQQAEKNAMDGISLIQTAEGALGEVHDMLSRMRELAVQASNGTLTETDREVIQDEINQLREQIDRVGNDTQFNTKKLLNGSLSENADIRSLYGTVQYSKQGSGLREVAVDPASILSQDVYSLNVVTTSKVVSTTEVNGTDDPYKTGIENVLLSPDSELGKGSYNIVLSSDVKSYDVTKYENAIELKVPDSVTNGSYSIEYDKQSKNFSVFQMTGGVKTQVSGVVVSATPAVAADQINKTVKITAPTTPATPDLKDIEFTITDTNQNAVITFEKATQVESSTISKVDVSASVLEDGYYSVETDGTGKASIYRLNENGEKDSAALETITITNSATGASAIEFPKYKIKIETGAAATTTAATSTKRATFKQGTEYTMTVKKGTDIVGENKSILFGDEGINLRSDDTTTTPQNKPLGVTVDFTNAATGYVKRGGKLPEAPATSDPYFSFNVDQMKRTSVILKDSSAKVIAHQFVDNDRKFVELKGTGISFGTGVLSDGEKAANIDIRRNLEDSSVVFQVGTNSGEIVELGIGDIRTKALGIDKFKLTDEESASNAIAIIDTAIDKVSEVRSKLGAYQNRMEHTVNNITQSTENLTSAESRIRDADMAKEMTEFTKLNIINQSATAMLAQANQLPQGILQLLKG